ncbi:hypothetical protein [Mycobacterium deserti]|uniref:NAD(P)-binding domain-containing protein n=1 Tax=Mycobacterium deserti TaxID=2978347 RepID=A0ABT2MBT0_9MYCO|nr:hypothetical protein [Mycobacterium deserti]MCT7659712.1 hypothetical protein [Mycobacterium deserti]
MRTTERGLPLALRLGEAALQSPPQQLAAEILALCRVSAARAQVTRRRELAENGFDASVIRPLHLATDGDLARAEGQAYGNDEDLPPTWLRSV